MYSSISLHTRPEEIRRTEKLKPLNKKTSKFFSDESTSLRRRWRLVFVAVVIAAVAVAIVAVEASPMPVQLHVPLEAGSALVAGEHARGEVASLDVCHQ